LHRDIKPTNILINEQSDGKVLARLTDFGIGQVVKRESLDGITQAGFTQTMSGEGPSSPGGSQLYMAPELLAGNPATLGADVYALGVVIFQLITGDFKRPLTQDWATQVENPLLRRLLGPMFLGDPNQRPADCGQIARDLRGWETQQKELAQKAATFKKRDRWRFRGYQIAGIFFILLGVGACANLQGGSGLAAIILGMAALWCAATRYRGGTPSIIGGLIVGVGLGAFITALPTGALVNLGAWLFLAFFVGVGLLLLNAGHKLHRVEMQRLREEFGLLLTEQPRLPATPPLIVAAQAKNDQVPPLISKSARGNFQCQNSKHQGITNDQKGR
jgi:hypothetical protein